MHIRCTAIAKNSNIPLLDIEWDEVAGTVTGTGADYLHELASAKTVGMHPLPGSHVLSTSPLVSREDMAAMIGLSHHLPDWLQPYYPAYEAQDMDGVEVQLIY